MQIAEPLDPHPRSVFKVVTPMLIHASAGREVAPLNETQTGNTSSLSYAVPPADNRGRLNGV